MIVLVSACLPLLLACAAALLSWSHRRSLLKFGSAIALIWVWLNACGALNAVYLRVLVPTPWPIQLASTSIQPKQAIAVILLGGGTKRTGPGQAPRPAGDSIEKLALTAAIYQQAIAQQDRVEVIVSGGDPQRHGITEADNYAPDLASLGVPPDAIVKENRSFNTLQNARFVAAILAKQRTVQAAPALKANTIAAPTQLVLITTAIHMRRSLLDFGRMGLHPIALAPPVHTLHWGFWPTSLRFAQANANLHELIGIAQFYVYRRLGWN